MKHRQDNADFRTRVDEVRDRHLLSAIVGRHTDLKKRGGRELSGLCPFHSERTPSFEVNDAKGVYHCHGCGKSGDVFAFLMEREGVDFRGAFEILSGGDFPVVSAEDRAKRRADDDAKTKARIDLALSFWEAGGNANGSLAEVYARSRGITSALPDTIRFAQIPRYVNTDTGEVGRNYPAMVCALQDASGAVTGVQAVYLAADGRGKYAAPNGGKAKLTWGQAVGSCIRLGPTAEHVVLCEGPEDGLALMQEMPTASVWVCCGAAMMHQVQLPPEVHRVTLAGDSGTAGAKAVGKARVVYARLGLEVEQSFPAYGFKDWNDQLRGVRG